MSQIKISWYVTDIFFYNATPGRNFKLTEYTSLADIKDEIHYFLSYGDNRRIVKLEYRSPSINNEEKIEFNNFEPKINVRAMWNIFFYFEIKIPLKLKAKIPRLVKDILKMLYG